MIKDYKSYVLLIFAVLIVLSGCGSIVPATTPPQLRHTPGAPITITDNQIDGGWFTLDYPDGWRVVANIAVSPVLLTIVSPDDVMIITVSDTTNIIFSQSTPQAGIHYRWVSLRDGERVLTVSGEINEELTTQFDNAFNEIVDSIEFP